MAIGKDSALRLVLIDDQANEAEAIVSGLRNAGIAVRPTRAADADELAAVLAQQPVDLVLAEYRSQHLPFSEAAPIVASGGRDVPVLAVLDGVDDSILEDVREAGGAGVALRGRPGQLLAAVRDAWEALDARRSQRRLEAQVRETERRCDMLIDSSRDPVAYVHEGMHIRANPAYLEMFGFADFDEIEGMSLLDLVAPAHVAEFKALLKSLSKGEPPPPRYELQAIDAEGNPFPAVMEFTAAQYEGEPCQQVIFRRQAQDPELARQLEELKQRDPATGLYNRPTFLQQLDEAIGAVSARGARHGLLLLEPDHYGQLLQGIGLDQADQLLAAVAARLSGVLGEGASAARFGEHQLAVLARDSDHATTAELAERVRKAFADSVLKAGSHSLNVTVSIGGVQIGEKNASASQVLAKASQGVASVLGAGGNRVEIFDPGAVDRAEEERIAAWVARIRQALEQDGFKLRYQPVISLQGDTSETYEVYVQMQGSDGEPVPAEVFVPIAEEHGLLDDIDRWMLQRAIAVIGERLRKGRRTRLLLTLAPEALADEKLASFVGVALSEAGVPGELLLLAIPESKVFTNLHGAQELAKGLAAFGVRLALDHFGAGLNSQQLLSHFDPAFLKIDPQFLQDLAKNAESQARVREIASDAASRGIGTIAPQVQDAASMTLLFSSGVEYVQGEFLAPVSNEMDYDFS